MTRCGFPHSEIHGSTLVCSSPWLNAAYHVLHRLLMPRHSPSALSSLTTKIVGCLGAIHIGWRRCTAKPKGLACCDACSRTEVRCAGFSHAPCPPTDSSQTTAHNSQPITLDCDCCCTLRCSRMRAEILEVDLKSCSQHDFRQCRFRTDKRLCVSQIQLVSRFAYLFFTIKDTA